MQVVDNKKEIKREESVLNVESPVQMDVANRV